MKKIILSTAIALALFCSAFANRPENVTDRAAASFKKDFNNASEVSWSVKTNFVMATFVQDKETLFAYYDLQGNLIGIVHHTLTSALPEGLRKDIRKHYANYWVTELFEISGDSGSSYYIQLKNADETVVLSTEGTNSWHRYAMPKNKTANL